MNQVVEQDILQIISSSQLDWSRLKGKKFFISGASGMIGSYLVYTLMKLNEVRQLRIHVHAVGRTKSKLEEKFKMYDDNVFFKYTVSDICDFKDFSEDLNYIIHAASPASPKYYGLDPVGTINANVIGTKNLLEIARKKKLDAFIYVSSSEVYGNPEVPENGIHEEAYGPLDPMNIRSCYAESKRLGENLCISYGAQYAVPVRVLRPFHTYAPTMELHDGRVFADFVANIVNCEDIVLSSDGAARRSFCYITDAIRGYFLVLMAGQDNQAYNVGNPTEELSVLELAEKLVNLFPEKSLKVKRRIADEGLGYIRSKVAISTPSIEKLKKLGWMPEITLEDGFKRVIRAFESDLKFADKGLVDENKV